MDSFIHSARIYVATCLCQSLRLGLVTQWWVRWSGWAGTAFQNPQGPVLSLLPPATSLLPPDNLSYKPMTVKPQSSAQTFYWVPDPHRSTSLTPWRAFASDGPQVTQICKVQTKLIIFSWNFSSPTACLMSNELGRHFSLLRLALRTICLLNQCSLSVFACQWPMLASLTQPPEHLPHPDLSPPNNCMDLARGIKSKPKQPKGSSINR